jgi:archaellum component FlaC
LHAWSAALVMSEPYSHTLRVLIEFRNEFKEFKSETGKSFADIREHFERIDDRFERVDTRLETITRALANEIVQAKFVTTGIDQRFAEIERLLSALEQRR